MVIKYYYGKKTNFVGKTLFEILANLRNFGVNRMLIKQEELLKNPNTKCYYIVKKVEPVMDKDLKEGAIYAQHIYKGGIKSGLVFVDEESWHTDWQLVPKNEEHIHRDHEQKPYVEEVKEIKFRLPPLMKAFLERQKRPLPT